MALGPALSLPLHDGYLHKASSPEGMWAALGLAESLEAELAGWCPLMWGMDGLPGPLYVGKLRSVSPPTLSQQPDVPTPTP